jgi:hypothetical protein
MIVVPLIYYVTERKKWENKKNGFSYKTENLKPDTLNKNKMKLLIITANGI